MKKIAITVLMLCQGIVFALPVGNPAEPSLFPCGIFFSGAFYDPCSPCSNWYDALSLRAGYYGDFVFNRNLEIEGKGLEQGKVIEKTELTTNAAYFVLNIANKMDLFGTLGESRIQIDTSEVSWVLNGNSLSSVRPESKLSWSAGARGTLFSWRCFSIGAEGQYFQTAPDLTEYISFSSGDIINFNENNKTTYKEWQAGLGLSYTLKGVCPNFSFVPYGAVKWSWVRYHTRDFTFSEPQINDGEPFTIFNLESHKLWGYAVGASFIICERIGVTVEGRFGDEEAVYVNGQFSF